MTASRPPGRSRLIALYPGAWRRRYGDEFADLLADRPPSLRDRLDIVRGALDAHLHPAEPSFLPGVAAVVGGGVWIVGTWPILALPAPPDWPGYLLEAIPLAIGAVVALTVAVIGAWLRLDRTADRRARRLGGLGLGLAVAGHLAWTALLVATLSGAGYGWPVAVASTLAGVGTLLVGLALVRVGDWPIAGLLVAAPVVLALPPAAVPSTIAWLAFGGLWIAVGVVELLEDRRGLDRPGPGRLGTR